MFIFLTAVFYAGIFRSPTVFADGDLIVDFNAPGPMFELNNMKPGDSENRDVDVTNNGDVIKQIAIKGVRKDGTTELPLLEEVLQIQITENSNTLFGPSTMQNFFDLSGSENGISLGSINPDEHKTFNILVTFPTSAGNGYQAKSVKVDFSIGEITSDNLVINEVYYNPKLIFFLSDLFDRIDKDHFEDRLIAIDKKRIFRRQWIEIYNPTDHDISLKNWSLTDNSGKKMVIWLNKKVKAHSYILISKNPALWWFIFPFRFFNHLELGRFIGNGLDIAGDRVILKDNKGNEIDRMSWGTDTSGFTPPAVNPKVSVGHSTERLAAGYDTNTASDWLDRHPPTPSH